MELQSYNFKSEGKIPLKNMCLYSIVTTIVYQIEVHASLLILRKKILLYIYSILYERPYIGLHVY